MLYQNIMADIKQAMRDKNVGKRDVLKMAAGKAQAIAKESKCDITDEIMLDAIQKELKQLQQTLSCLIGNEDSDLYQSTTYKISILKKYLPKMMSEEEVLTWLENNLEISGNINKGTIMKTVMPKLKGKAENKVIAKCVDTYLNEVGTQK